MYSKKRLIISLIITILIMAFIFVQSALSADLSRAESGLITEWLAGILKADPEPVSFAVRKCAHFLEYLVLGVSLSFTVREFARRGASRGSGSGVRSDIPAVSGTSASGQGEADTQGGSVRGGERPALCGAISWGIGTLYAVSDEIHQMFSEGRSCELRDICIDAGGVLLGILIINLIWRSRRRSSS